jgi:hypothetical protein
MKGRWKDGRDNEGNEERTKGGGKEEGEEEKKVAADGE